MTVKAKRTGRPVSEPILDFELKEFVQKEREEHKFLSTKRFLAFAKKGAKALRSELKIS